MVKLTLNCQRHAINLAFNNCLTPSDNMQLLRLLSSPGYKQLPLHPPHLKVQMGTQAQNWVGDPRAAILWLTAHVEGVIHVPCAQLGCPITTGTFAWAWATRQPASSHHAVGESQPMRIIFKTRTLYFIR